MSTAEPWFDEIREVFRPLDAVSEVPAGLGDSLPILRKLWEGLVGTLVDDMLASRETAERYLRDARPSVRKVALAVVSGHWGAKAGDDCVGVCEDLSIHEADADVRSVALCALGSCYHGTDDVRVGRFLSTIVHDEAESQMCRLAAYDALYSLRGTAPPLQPAVGEDAPRSPGIPAELDWSFVDTFLEVARIPWPVATLFDATVVNLREPERTAAWLFREGCAAYERGDFASAVEIFTRSINAASSQAGVYIMRGGALFKLARLDEAIGDFTRAIELRRHAPRAYRSRAVAYEAKGRRDLAEADRHSAAKTGKVETGN
jgi:tetratricopeptide (TPR) repeat protein